MASNSLALTQHQADAQSSLLRDVSHALAKSYVVALARWLGDPKLMRLGLPYLVEGYRSDAVQAAYFAQGRLPLADVLRLRAAAGLPAIGAAEAGRIITYKRPGQSLHNHLPSEAIDVALLQVDGSLKWDNAALVLFSRLLLAADARIVWGGDFNHNGRTDDEQFHDWDHFQLTA